MTQNLSYGQLYYAKRMAQKLGITVEQYLASKPGSVAPPPQAPKPVDFSKVTKLRNLNITEGMLKCNLTGLPIDDLFSYERGVPVGTNIMCTGDPGVGKTTLLLHTLAHLAVNHQGNGKRLRCLFICAEMNKIQMWKYTQRFPIFGEVDTIFTSDYMHDNLKDVLEQLLDCGYDYVLMDSIVEVLETVREDNGWGQSQAEKWLIDLCIKHNEGHNQATAFTSMLLIQQVTKNGLFVGSNKIKHITDAHMEMRRRSERDGGDTYIQFSKNRNGQSGIQFGYQLSNDRIEYGTVRTEVEDEGDFSLDEPEKAF